VIRAIANTALKSLSGEFQKLYSPLGRESIPPERLLRALLLRALPLQAFYSVRSERQLVERIVPLYMYQAAYTPESWAAQLKNPQNRVEAVGRAACEAVGGKLIGQRRQNPCHASKAIHRHRCQKPQRRQR
jgi:hypothetical protein